MPYDAKKNPNNNRLHEQNIYSKAVELKEGDKVWKVFGDMRHSFTYGTVEKVGGQSGRVYVRWQSGVAYQEDPLYLLKVDEMPYHEAMKSAAQRMAVKSVFSKKKPKNHKDGCGCFFCGLSGGKKEDASEEKEDSDGGSDTEASVKIKTFEDMLDNTITSAIKKESGCSCGGKSCNCRPGCNCGCNPVDKPKELSSIKSSGAAPETKTVMLEMPKNLVSIDDFHAIHSDLRQQVQNIGTSTGQGGDTIYIKIETPDVQHAIGIIDHIMDSRSFDKTKYRVKTSSEKNHNKKCSCPVCKEQSVQKSGKTMVCTAEGCFFVRQE